MLWVEIKRRGGHRHDTRGTPLRCRRGVARETAGKPRRQRHPTRRLVQQSFRRGDLWLFVTAILAVTTTASATASMAVMPLVALRMLLVVQHVDVAALFIIVHFVAMVGRMQHDVVVLSGRSRWRLVLVGCVESMHGSDTRWTIVVLVVLVLRLVVLAIAVMATIVTMVVVFTADDVKEPIGL